MDFGFGALIASPFVKYIILTAVLVAVFYYYKKRNGFSLSKVETKNSIHFQFSNGLIIAGGSTKVISVFGDTYGYATSTPKSLMVGVDKVFGYSTVTATNVGANNLPVWSNVISLGSINNL